ncbi:MAG: molecular chaperone DnaJ [Anaerolineaceae bacterium]|nr:molecular chaperone DnaJ [Anaerolineaceae bacterium]
MPKHDFYEILGVGKSASQDQIKSAFRNLARKYHPDVNNDPNAEERFKEINEAYMVLSDEEKRTIYDRFGYEGLANSGGMPDWNTVDPFEIFNQFFGGFNTRQRRNAPRRGEDLYYSITIEFKETASGVDRELEITRDEVCERCNGSGAEPGTKPTTCSTCKGRGEVRQVRQTFLGSMVQVTTCPECGGTGHVIAHKCSSCGGRGYERKKRIKTIPIPAGVDNGTQIRLSGEGQPGINGGPRGNLYIEIKVKPHKFFRRRKDDVLLNLNINIAQAVLGAKIKVPTLDGDETLIIPSGTQPGKVFKLRNKGIPHLRHGGRGDQLVIINVNIPSRLTSRQRQIFEQLAETLGSEVLPQEHSFLDTIKDFFGG